MSIVIPDVTETELQNALGIVPPGSDEIQVIAGCSSAGTSGVLAAYASIPGLVADFGYGPMVEEATRSLEDSDGTPVIVYKTPSATPGSVGAVDGSKVTGTAALTVTGAPFDDYEGYFVCTTAGTIGVAPGPAGKWSLANGRDGTLSPETSFGVGDTIPIPNSGIAILASPGSTDATALNTLINDAFTKQNAHVILTTGTVHTSADSADVLSSGTYPSATTTATRIARVNAICAAYELHRVKGSGASIHINAGGDTVDGLTILTPAVDDETALARILDWKAKYALHIAGTTWHTIADATNTVTDPAPSPGTLNVGDVITFPCTAPKWGISDLTALFAALVSGQQDFGFVQIAGPVSATEAATVATGLDSLRAAHKPSWAIVGARGPNAGENESAWTTAIENDYAGTNRPDLAVCAGTAWVTSAVSGFQYTRRITGSVAARAVKAPIYVDLAKVSDGPLPNLAMFDSKKNPICHNEATNPGLMGARFITLRTFSTKGLAPYITNPVLMSTPGSDFDLVQKRRVMNVLERTVYDFGLTVDLNAEGTVDPDTGFISETAARDLEIEMIEAITEALGAAISDPEDPKLFVLSRTDPVSTNGGHLTADSRIVGLFYIKNLAVTTGFRK